MKCHIIKNKCFPGVDPAVSAGLSVGYQFARDPLGHLILIHPHPLTGLYFFQFQLKI